MQVSVIRYWPWLVAMVLVFLWGLAVGQYQVFPYQQIRAVKNLVDGEDGTRDPNEYIGSPEAVVIGSGDSIWGTRADVAMVGDSITAQGRWNEMFPGASIVNRGVGGDTVGGVRERLDSIVAVRAKRYFLMIGTNDALFRNPDDAFMKHYAAVLDALQEGGADVYVHPILQCGEMPQCTPETRDRITRLNAKIEALAQSKGARVIDLNEMLSDENGLLAEVTWDGLHLNSEGFRRWRDAIADEVEQGSAERE